MEIETASRSIEETWNLRDLFPDDATFEQARREFQESVLPAAARYQGRLGESATLLADALELIGEASKQLRLLHCYASLRSDADIRIAAHRAMRQEVELLATELARRTSFLRPEILALEPEIIDRFLQSEPRLASHAHFLRDLLRQREHVLGPQEEAIVAESGLLSRGPSALYLVLNNTELPRPQVRLDGGETIQLTPVAFQRHRTTAHRADRLRIFPAYFSAYRDFEQTLGQNLYNGIKSHLFYARVRRYPSCLAAALGPDNVPESVYRNLVRQVNARLPTLHRYFRLRARSLQLERLEYPDLYCSMAAAPARRYSADQTQRLIRDGLAPLGPDYVSALEAAFRSRWIDWHPSAGKRAGAYATGWAYDFHPYVLLNHNGDYDSVLTTAHEMGHAMHSYFSNRKQPFPTADYSIFVAEVASTFNEVLLLRRMLESTASGDSRLFLLGSYLDGIRGTLFRQVMFAEFELDLHERVERGEVLTGEALSAIYLALLRRYHGHDVGAMHIADAYAVEWAAIPHLYYNFYVYQYATGITAATALARAVLTGEPDPLRRYLAFLQSGGSDYPLELLQHAGVDLTSAGPYDAAFATIDRHLDELEECLDGSCRSPA